MGNLLRRVANMNKALLVVLISTLLLQAFAGCEHHDKKNIRCTRHGLKKVARCYWEQNFEQQFNEIEGFRPRCYDVEFMVEDIPGAPLCSTIENDDDEGLTQQREDRLQDFPERRVRLVAVCNNMEECGTDEIELASAQINCDCEASSGSARAPNEWLLGLVD